LGEHPTQIELREKQKGETIPTQGVSCWSDYWVKTIRAQKLSINFNKVLVPTPEANILFKLILPPLYLYKLGVLTVVGIQLNFRAFRIF